MTAKPQKPSIGQLLLDKGLISSAQLALAMQKQNQTGELLGSLLVRLGFISEEVLLPVLADQLRMRFVRLNENNACLPAISKVPAKFANRYKLFPFHSEENLVEVAVSDPFNVQALDELSLLLGSKVRPVLAIGTEIQQAIERYYGLGASTVEQLIGSRKESSVHVSFNAEEITGHLDEASVVSFVNHLLNQAVNDRATDIHIEPYECSIRIRQRIDGMLYEMPIPADLVKLHQAIASRIKVMAKLDISEKRLPQDGRIRIRLGPEDIDLRVSVLPTAFGEAVDIRILSSRMLYGFENLGFEPDHLQLISGLLERPHGIIFVTGPTGSGKTTTLYACLMKLNQPGRKIITIEDPVECQIQGMTQVQVHPKIGLSFAQGLRSMLRHDPDIMMVGEVRDPETAEITIRSSLTGHLVFSTLHTNDAGGGIARLLDMGIEPYLVSSSVLCFISQRLIRLVCDNCKQEYDAGPELARQFLLAEVPKKLMRARGCIACKGTGYAGRTAIYEFLVVDEALQHQIMHRASSNEIMRSAQKRGMRAIRQNGWLKIKQGMTTVEEVLRVS